MMLKNLECEYSTAVKCLNHLFMYRNSFSVKLNYFGVLCCMQEHSSELLVSFFNFDLCLEEGRSKPVETSANKLCFLMLIDG